ncbi:PREDICTED: plastid division protein PDV2-like, partial [Tarenaya hassleriana]|uniref:plastid division protein PDV2-like n=1 Tax=Tarenaya hassleriana TaxID=28532 RepID=UPI00053C4BD0
LGLILARATELRLKIGDCIDDASSASASDGEGHCRNSGGESSSPGGGREGQALGNFGKNSDLGSGGDVVEDEDEEAERLLHVHDALESLESQLAALQNLRQRQQYEKQMALSEIDYSRKMLLEKLSTAIYRGIIYYPHLQYTHARGVGVDHENDLLLPPYPTHPPPATLVSDNGYLPHLNPKQKTDGNGLISSNVIDKEEEKKKNSPYREPENSCNGVIRFAGSVAKIVLPIIGVISILSASGYGPEIRKRGESLNLLGFILSRAKREERSPVQCPPGKVLVMEGDGARCIVKERVELPFDSAVAKHDVTYGYG